MADWYAAFEEGGKYDFSDLLPGKVHSKAPLNWELGVAKSEKKRTATSQTGFNMMSLKNGENHGDTDCGCVQFHRLQPPQAEYLAR